MAGPMPPQGDRADWCRERLDFFCAVINNLDRESLKAELEACETEEEAAGLMHSLLWLQDNMHVHYPGGAAANDPPDRHDLPDDETFLEGHQPLYVAVENPPVQQPHHHYEDDLNFPVAAGEPHILLQDPVYLGDHNQQRHHDEQQQQQTYEDREAFPMAACQPQVLEDAAYLEDHNQQHYRTEEQQQQQQQQQQQLHEQKQQQQQNQEQQQHEGYEELQDQPPRRTDPLELDSASNITDDHDLHQLESVKELPERRPSDDPSDSEEQDVFQDITEDQEWVEGPEIPHNHDCENIPMVASGDGDTDGDENTEPMEPPSEKDESDPYFDADEPSAEDFVDIEEELVVLPAAQADVDPWAKDSMFVEEVPIEDELVVPPVAQVNIEPSAKDFMYVEEVLIEDELVVPPAAQANIEPASVDLEVEGAVGGHEQDTKDDERLAQELSEAFNKEERERMANDERMARELEEQMEMEERRREEEDEELARRLANELEGEEMEQQQQPPPQGQDNNPPEDIIADTEVEDNQVLMTQEEDVDGDEEIARQMEAEALVEIREEEDERAGRVAALINMFPDADPTYLDWRMENVETEEAFRNTVEALLQSQRTEPRMSGYQKILKQSHAARAADSVHHEAPQEPMSPLATTSAAAASSHMFECTICFEEEVQMKNVASCNALYNYHEFCIECVRKHVAALIGQGHSSFRCMNGYCEAEFSWRTLRRVMEPVVYRKVQERRQQEEVMAAGVENLVACPFCCFMIIMPDPENKVLECLNPECLKESCRVCKETSHIPLRCEEVEREAQKDARTMLENKMAEAMIRQCPKCGKRFVTEGGCNKMTCSCGTVMCYLCKRVISDGYKHFEQRGGVASGKCPLWSDATVVHRDEVRDAAAQGKEELAPDVKLVHDPTNSLP